MKNTVEKSSIACIFIFSLYLGINYGWKCVATCFLNFNNDIDDWEEEGERGNLEREREKGGGGMWKRGK